MKNSIIEIWQPVPGYEGLYEASNLGEIRSLNYRCTGKVRVLKPGISAGYFQVVLYRDGKKKKFLVHRLVWISFRGTIPKGLVVNHLNEIKTDNRLSNLEICTVKENNNFGTRNERASKAMTGKTPWNKGKTFSEEAKAKMSESHKGQTPWNKGKKCKPHTAEHKAKISKSLKARHKREKSLGINNHLIE